MRRDITRACGFQSQVLGSRGGQSRSQPPGESHPNPEPPGVVWKLTGDGPHPRDPLLVVKRPHPGEASSSMHGGCPFRGCWPSTSGCGNALPRGLMEAWPVHHTPGTIPPLCGEQKRILKIRREGGICSTLVTWKWKRGLGDGRRVLGRRAPSHDSLFKLIFIGV